MTKKYKKNCKNSYKKLKTAKMTQKSTLKNSIQINTKCENSETKKHSFTEDTAILLRKSSKGSH